MSGRQQLARCLGVWLALGIFCSVAMAQLSHPPAQGPQFPSESPIPQATEHFYFGVMGQVARPGVYELVDPQPQLVDIIGYAGGLTQQASHQIRIVRRGTAGQLVSYSPSLYFPLLSGDVVVVDEAPASQIHESLQVTPRFSSTLQGTDVEAAVPLKERETFRHVALMNVLDRPVILPVPEQHADLPAIISYLGQNPAIGADVKVQPVGPGRSAPAFVVPTVLYFNPLFIQQNRLPKLPETYQVKTRLPMPVEQKTADASDVPSLPALPLSPASDFPGPNAPNGERFQSSAFSPMDFPDPPLIAKIREREQQIPSPAARSVTTPMPPQESARQTVSVSENLHNGNGESQTEETSSWWPYLGVLFVILIGGGACYIRWRGWQWQQMPPASFVIEPRPVASPPRREEEIQPNAPSQPKRSSPLGRLVLKNKMLTALVFNQLPVLEESTEHPPAKPAEDKSPPQKIFRVDPSEPQAAAKAPYIARKPSTPSMPVEMKPLASEPTAPSVLPLAETTPAASQTPGAPAKDAKQGQGLLDRVLQQVHQKRAA